MKFTYSKVFLFITAVLAITFTSCEEGATMDIPGPDINFEFTYSDSLSNSLLKSGNTGYRLVAQSDTIQGRDIEAYLDNLGRDYSSVIESATISNALFTVTGDANLTGVDSVQIRYSLAGSNEEMVLAQAGIDSINAKDIRFDDLQIDKVEAFELIKSNVVAKIYAIYDKPRTNCFENGTNYKFTAKTTLSVKLSALTEGVLSTGK